MPRMPRIMSACWVLFHIWEDVTIVWADSVKPQKRNDKRCKVCGGFRWELLHRRKFPRKTSFVAAKGSLEASSNANS